MKTKKHPQKASRHPRKNGEVKKGFDYEEKFIAVMRMAEQEIFQLSLGTVPKSKNLKKNS